MSHLIDTISLWLFIIFWTTGFVIAKGFWSTLFCWFPFYSFYLIIEKDLQVIGWV